MHPMIRRQQAAQSCVDRFVGKAYAPGTRDCVKLAAHALHKMGVKVGSLKGVRWSTESGGVKALRKAGYKSLVEAVDGLGLVRIAPAAALSGDLLALAGEGEGFGAALAVSVGGGRAVGFVNGYGGVIEPLEFLCAWRVEPCRK